MSRVPCLRHRRCHRSPSVSTIMSFVYLIYHRFVSDMCFPLDFWFVIFVSVGSCMRLVVKRPRYSAVRRRCVYAHYKKKKKTETTQCSRSKLTNRTQRSSFLLVRVPFFSIAAYLHLCLCVRSFLQKTSHYT